jgi:hypothetical protein
MVFLRRPRMPSDGPAARTAWPPLAILARPRRDARTRPLVDYLPSGFRTPTHASRTC